MTNPEKLASLIVILMIAITWAYRCATQAMGMKAIPRKTHRRREKSWFRIGFDALRHAIFHNQQKAIAAWCAKAPKRPISSKMSL